MENVLLILLVINMLIWSANSFRDSGKFPVGVILTSASFLIVVLNDILLLSIAILFIALICGVYDFATTKEK